MKSRFFRIVKPLMFVLVVSLLGWLPVSASTSDYNSDELTRRIKTGGYLQKTDNLMIILDGSGKQSFFGLEPSQIKTGKTLIRRIGQTIPRVPHRRMLRVFGPAADGFKDDFSTIFGLFDTDARDYTPIIATKTFGISDNDPLELTFFSAIADLKKLSGTHAVILISRGDQFSKEAIAESAYLKKAFGGSICFYPIFIGKDASSEARMVQFKQIGGCGSFATYDDLDSPEKMTDYVESVFFAKKRTFTPPPKPVVEDEVIEATAPDMEENGLQVVDEEPYEPELIGDIEEEVVAEEIPDTSDVIIIERQLPHDKVVTIELHVEFDLNKATVKKEFTADIQNIADFMNLYPETEVLLEGHTCSLGSEAYNLALSKKRAEAVQNTLINDFGIAPERIKTHGAGESEPIADNSTEEGRVRNRRVMAVISTIVTDFIIIEQEISKEEFLSDDFVLPPIEESLQGQIQPVENSEEPEVEAAPALMEETAQPEVDETSSPLADGGESSFDTNEEAPLTVTTEPEADDDLPNWK